MADAPDEALQTLVRAFEEVRTHNGPGRGAGFYDALDTLREELSRREPTYDGKTAQEWAIENEKLEAQLERQEAALRDIGFATLHCTHGTKVRNILKRRGLSTPLNQEDPE